MNPFARHTLICAKRTKDGKLEVGCEGFRLGIIIIVISYYVCATGRVGESPAGDYYNSIPNTRLLHSPRGQQDNNQLTQRILRRFVPRGID